MLKPQREGGANNFYGDDIPKKLDEICGGDGKEKNAYILMDRITPMEHLNVQLRPGAEIKVGLESRGHSRRRVYMLAFGDFICMC